MALDYSGGYCEVCNAERKIERKAPNHILHLLIVVVLGVFTAGVGAVIWVIVWILISIRFGGWMCSTCGSRKIKFKKPL